MTETPFRVTLPVNTPEIERLLPHRYPFLLVDRVIEFEKDKRVLAYKNVTCNEPFFTGHFPGRPVMPGVLVVEALAQAGGLLTQLSRDPARSARTPSTWSRWTTRASAAWWCRATAWNSRSIEARDPQHGAVRRHRPRRWRAGRLRRDPLRRSAR
jgi:hypothetical protein